MSRAARYVTESADGLEVLGTTVKALRDGKPKEDIVHDLRSRGVDAVTAYEMIDFAQECQSEYLRRQGGRDIIWGFVLAAAGAAITYATWAAAASGGSYFILWGLIVWGGFRLLRGFYRCVRYAVDSAARSRWVVAAVLCVAAISLGGLALYEHVNGPTGWTAPSGSYVVCDDKSGWLSESQSLLTVQGTVRNTHSQYSIRSVCIEVQALSSAGEVLCTEKVSVLPATIGPGSLGMYSATLFLPYECVEAVPQLVWEWVP